MNLGMIGLGKMGGNMVTRLLRGGHRVVVHDLAQEAVDRAVAEGATAARSVHELVAALAPPRSVWVMVPAGSATEAALTALVASMAPGDVIVDGGNSNYRDSQRRGAAYAARGVRLLDVGTSGGIWGLAEGFALLQRKETLGIDLHQVSELWRTGSVIRSWLLDLTAAALDVSPTLEGIAPYVPDSGEGRWTAIEAIELGLSLPVITLALQQRFRSRDDGPFADKLLSAMRGQFGGHAVRRTRASSASPTSPGKAANDKGGAS